MAYPIQLGISDVDHDKKTLKVHGLKVSFKYLEEIIITPILNGLKPSESVAVDIMKQLAAAGLRTGIWQAFAQAAAWEIEKEQERAEKLAREAKENAERMESMRPLTQKEISERDANRMANIAKFRNSRGSSAF